MSLKNFWSAKVAGKNRFWRKSLPLVLGAFACLGGAQAEAQTGRASYVSHGVSQQIVGYDQWGRPICRPCPVPYSPGTPSPRPITPSPDPMGTTQDPMPTTADQFADTSTADLQFAAPEAGLGSADVAFNAPAMIGDFFGSGSSTVVITQPASMQTFTTMTTRGGMLRLASDTSIQSNFLANGPMTMFDQTSPQPATFGGITVANPGTFTAAGPVVDPALIPLSENPNLTNAILASVPNATAAVPNFTQAVTDPNNPGVIYFINTNYNVTQTFNQVFQPAPIVLTVPSPSTGGSVVGRQKIAENTSPMPRDRVFTNYSYFDNTPLQSGGVNVNRITPGFEKTFWCGNASFEMRFPFASTLTTDIIAGGQNNTDDTTFGNINMVWKFLLHQSETFAWSSGLSLTVPTGDNLSVALPNGLQVIKVDNEAVHLLPFTGFLWTPDDRFFMQAFIQADFDANGNSVFVDSGLASGMAGSGHLIKAGKANDQTFMFYDVSMGYWLYNSPHSDFITGLAPIFEMHLNQSVQDSDTIQSGAFAVGTGADEIQNLNSVLGLTARIGDSAFLTGAYALPIGNGSDQQFDGEARVTFNWYFGGPRNRRFYNSVLP